MFDAVSLPSKLPEQSRVNDARSAVLFLCALLFCLYAWFGHPPKPIQIGLAAASLSMASVVMLYVLKIFFDRRVSLAVREVFLTALNQDPRACFLADSQGEIVVSNNCASTKFDALPGNSLVDSLRATFANPSSVLARLQARATKDGYVVEDVVNNRDILPVAVRILNENLFCWTIGQSVNGRFDTVSQPVLSIGRAGEILDMNEAATRLFRKPLTSIRQLVDDQWDYSDGVTSVQTSRGAMQVATCELDRSDACRHIMLVPQSNDCGDESWTPFSDLPVPVMHLAPNGDILEANKLAENMVGQFSSEAANIEHVMYGLGRPIQDWLTEAEESATAPCSEFLRLNRKNTEMFVQVTLARIVRDGNVGLMAVLNDATELKTLEAQFVQSQKMQAVGQLAGGVAHDFNNLLTAISGHCDLLLLRHDQNDPNFGDLVQINQNANRAAALVSQLLAFSRKQTLRPEPLDLRDTISDLIHLLNRLVGEKVTLTLSHDPVLRPVRADKRQLEQVLMNLVVNARDAMPSGGEIRIETEVMSLNEPLIRDRATVPSGEYVTVKVIDSGTGIPPDKIQKVFEPFFTTKRTGEGTGLGLSTVYGIIKQTGGFIFVDSKPGKGAEFTVLLPVASGGKQTEVKAEILPETVRSRQGEGVVLLVEDEAPVRAFATRALRLRGYTVIEADSAENALKLLEDQDLRVDVFVTDVVMPGMDGPTWVRHAMKTRPEVRVIFMSGYTEGALEDVVPDLPNSSFLPKPFSLIELTETVFQQLN